MDQANQIVDILLGSGALKISADNPFRLASGLLSPFYIDCRLILSAPAGLSAVADLMAAQIRAERSESDYDIIAGGVTAGVPFATLVAERLAKPLIYIRPQPKAHGTGGQIEGGSVAGKRVLLIEDLITRASSVQKFHAALMNAEATIAGLHVIVSRADKVAQINLSEMRLSLSYLINIDGIIKALAQKSGWQNAAGIMDDYVNNPDSWSNHFNN